MRPFEELRTTRFIHDKDYVLEQIITLPRKTQLIKMETKANGKSKQFCNY